MSDVSFKLQTFLEESIWLLQTFKRFEITNINIETLESNILSKKLPRFSSQYYPPTNEHAGGRFADSSD